MAEETKKQEEVVEAVETHFGNIAEALGFDEGRGWSVIIHDSQHIPQSMKIWTPLKVLFGVENDPASAKAPKIYTIFDQRGEGVKVTFRSVKRHTVISEIADSEEAEKQFIFSLFGETVKGEEEEEQSISMYLTQIDQSREQAQAAQTEIDQLRTETRDLISKLLAA